MTSGVGPRAVQEALRDAQVAVEDAHRQVRHVAGLLQVGPHAAVQLAARVRRRGLRPGRDHQRRGVARLQRQPARHRRLGRADRRVGRAERGGAAVGQRLAQPAVDAARAQALAAPRSAPFGSPCFTCASAALASRSSRFGLAGGVGRQPVGRERGRVAHRVQRLGAQAQRLRMVAARHASSGSRWRSASLKAASRTASRAAASSQGMASRGLPPSSQWRAMLGRRSIELGEARGDLRGASSGGDAAAPARPAPGAPARAGSDSGCPRAPARRGQCLRRAPPTAATCASGRQRLDGRDVELVAAQRQPLQQRERRVGHVAQPFGDGLGGAAGQPLVRACRGAAGELDGRERVALGGAHDVRRRARRAADWPRRAHQAAALVVGQRLQLEQPAGRRRAAGARRRAPAPCPCGRRRASPSARTPARRPIASCTSTSTSASSTRCASSTCSSRSPPRRRGQQQAPDGARPPGGAPAGRAAVRRCRQRAEQGQHRARRRADAVEQAAIVDDQPFGDGRDHRIGAAGLRVASTRSTSSRGRAPARRSRGTTHSCRCRPARAARCRRAARCAAMPSQAVDLRTAPCARPTKAGPPPAGLRRSARTAPRSARPARRRASAAAPRAGAHTSAVPRRGCRRRARAASARDAPARPWARAAPAAPTARWRAAARGSAHAGARGPPRSRPRSACRAAGRRRSCAAASAQAAAIARAPAPRRPARSKASHRPAPAGPATAPPRRPAARFRRAGRAPAARGAAALRRLAAPASGSSCGHSASMT